jgi:hypothetical protein
MAMGTNTLDLARDRAQIERAIVGPITIQLTGSAAATNRRLRYRR